MCKDGENFMGGQSFDVPFCYGMGECFVKKFHIWLFWYEIFSHEQRREGVVQWEQVRFGCRQGSTCLRLLCDAASKHKERNSQRRRWQTSKTLIRFPFVTIYHRAMGPAQSKIRWIENVKTQTSLLRHACSYLRRLEL